MTGKLPMKQTDPGLVDAITGLNANANLSIVERTRRSVMEASQLLLTQRTRRRRNMGLVLLTLAAFILLLTPAIWSSVDDMLGGEHLFDVPAMVMSLILLLFSTVFAVLIGLRNQSSFRHSKR